MIRKVCGVALWALLALGAQSGFAAAPEVTFSPQQTAADGIVQCVYTAETRVDADGSIRIACAAAETPGLKAKLSGTSGCTYAEADVDMHGAINIRCNASKVAQTITFGTAPSLGVGKTGTVSATASSGLPVTFSSTTPNRCTVSGSTVTGVSAGNCMITATQAGNSIYASTEKDSPSFEITLGTQTISFGTAPTVTVGKTGSVSATASSGLPVTFTSTTTGICTVSGTTVTGVAAGTCIIAANQAGNASYSAAPQVTQNLDVKKPTVPTATFTKGASGCSYASVYVDSDLSIRIECADSSGASSTPRAKISSANLLSCPYARADVSNDGLISILCASDQPAAQTVVFGTAPTAISVGGTGTVSATADSGLPVIFSSQTAGTCTVSGTTVTGVAVGVCTIAANQAGNSIFNAASQVTQSLNITAIVGQTAQTINFTALPSVIVGGTASLSANASSGLPVIFSSLSTGICTVSGNTVTGVAAGTCTIAANQAGNSTYAPAPQATVSFGVTAKKTQAITFGAAPTVKVGWTETVSAAGGTSGLPVTFSSLTPGICTVSGSTVTGNKAGLCTVAANQEGNAEYSPAPQATLSLRVLCVSDCRSDLTPMLQLLLLDDQPLSSQSITFGAAPTVPVDGTGTVSATGGGSGNPVIFSSTTPTICSVSGTTVTGLAAGTCTIVANQAGNASYSAAPQVTQSFSVVVMATYKLTVKSSGASNVAISAPSHSSNYVGTTDYEKSGIVEGTGLNLYAPQTAGSATFSHWSGCGVTSGVMCGVTMNADKTVTATYTTP